jgi:hypothetical protein
MSNHFKNRLLLSSKFSRNNAGIIINLAKLEKNKHQNGQ